MSPTRRDFIKTTAATAAALASGPWDIAPAAQTPSAPAADPLVIELANAALDAARSSGASYADVRVGRYRRQAIHTRERQVAGVTDDESYGVGIRTLVDGCWGFAATSTMTKTRTTFISLPTATNCPAISHPRLGLPGAPRLVQVLVHSVKLDRGTDLPSAGMIMVEFGRGFGTRVDTD